MSKELTIPIPARLKNVAEGGHVTGVEDIYDDELQKTQKEINAERENDITNLDNEVSALQKQDIEVVADHTAVTNPDPKKIYREQGTESYTDYMYQNNAWKELATYAFPGVDDEPTAGSDNLVTSGGVESKVATLHKELIVTTTAAYYEVAIDKIPSGTKIVSVKTSVNADVFIRTDNSGVIGQEQISDGTTTTIDGYYIVTSTPCNVDIIYGYIDEVAINLNKELGGKIDGLHKIQNATTITAWYEVAIDMIPSGTKIVKVETSVPSEVYIRDVPGGSQGQQRIIDGTVTEFDAPYLLTSVPCSVTLVYGYIDEKLEGVDTKLEEIKASTNEIYNNQSVITTGAWAEVAIDTILIGTTISEVITSVPAIVALRLDASGAQGSQEITNGSVTTFDAHYLVTSVPCTVTLKSGIVADNQYVIKSKLSKIQNAIISDVTDNLLVNSIIRDLEIIDSSAVDTDVFLITDFYKNDSAAQLTIKKNGTVVCSFWTNNISSLELVTEIPAYNDSNITAKAIVDWTAATPSAMYATVKSSKIGSDFSIIPFLRKNVEYIQNAIISDATESAHINSFLRDIVVYDETATDSDVFQVTNFFNNGSTAQISIVKNGNVVSSFWTNDTSALTLVTKIPQFNNSGITAEAIIDWTIVPNNASSTRLKNNRINKDTSIIPYLSSSKGNRWRGKKMLAIGDSVTVGGQWANEVGRILGMSVSIHAKAGVGVITMVDGDSTLPALTTSDVADKDLICIMGLYNERTFALSNPGNESDMYPEHNSFIGRLNYAIDKIYKKLNEAENKNCIVVVISAHKYGKYPWSQVSSYGIVSVEGVQMQDGEALFSPTKKAAEYNSLPLIDLMHGGNINKYNWNYFQNDSSPYNDAYIPVDGENNGTNKPFPSLSDAPDASQNNGKYITVVDVANCYRSNGTEWVADSTPYIWNADQLHPNNAGYLRLASHIAQQLLTV